MGKSRDSRQESKFHYSTLPPCRIECIASWYTNKPKYIHIPTELTYSDHPSMWMSFNRKSLYYPLVFLDKNGHICKTKHMMDFEIEWTNPTKQLQKKCMKCKPDGSYIYWFEAIQLHVAGKVYLKFYSPDVPKIRPLKITVTTTREPVATSTTTPIGKAPESSSDPSAPSTNSEPEQASAHVSPPPVPPVLMHRPWLSPVTFPANTPSGSYTLSASLFGALQDDRIAPHDYSEPSVTVHQLLSHKRIAPTRPSNKSRQRHTSHVNTLLVAFEKLFLDRVLYMEEREALITSGVLSRLLSSDKNKHFYDHFGAKHLLRFLLLVIAKGPGDDATAPDTSASTKKRKHEDISSADSPKSENDSDIYVFVEKVLDMLQSQEFFPLLY